MSNYQQKTLAQLQDSKVTAALQSPPSQVASSKAVQRPALGKAVAGEQMLQEAVLDSAEQDGSAGSGQALEDEASAALPAQGFDAASEFESNSSLPVPGQGGGVDHASLSPSLQPSLQEPPWIQREKDERKGLTPLLGGNSSATSTPASQAQAPKEDASSMDTLRLLGGVLVAAGASGGAGSLLSDTQADVTPPTLVISSSAPSVKAGQSATITFTFSEVPKLFTTEDITTTNGVLSGLTVSADPKVYKATFKPLDNPTAPSASITVANASYVDGAGNTGAGATTNINVDTVAPLAPTINAVATNDIINAAEVASVISGNNEAGSSVTLSIGGNARAAVVNGASWSYALQASDISAMGEGPETLSVVQTDSAGNQSVAGKRDITVDTQAPVAPTIKGFEIGSKITGTNEAGASVALSIGENTPRAATVVGTSWSFTLIASDLALLGQGAATLSAVQTDAAGNKSPIGTAAISVDTEAPIAPVINVVATDDVINALEMSSTTITGLNEAGATVALSIGGNTRAAAVSGTSWSYALVPADITAMGQGAETLSVTQTDASGNTSAASTRAIMVDTGAPLALSINVVASDNIINAAEVASTITGSNEAGAVVSLSIGRNSRTAVVSGTTWSYALQADDITAMGQGTEILSATQTDASGNTSAASTRTITVDTAPKGAPVINAVASDDIVNASEVASTITGTNVAGSTVALSIGGNTRAATVSGTSWSYALQSSDITAMGQGTETLSVTQTDPSGNKSEAGTRSITVDTLVPAAPAINVVATDDIVNAAEVTSTLTGTNEAGSTVALSLGGNTRTATVSGTSWSYALQESDITAMGQGAETFSATQTDTAGNQSAAGIRSINVDTVAPTLAITSSTPTLKAGETAVITFTFSEDPGSTFTWNGSAGDVEPKFGTLGAISGSGLTRTATYTPYANLQILNYAPILVQSENFTDAAGNPGGGGIVRVTSMSIDTDTPTLAITSSTPKLKAGETAVITFRFSEDPGSTFTWNGSAGDVVLYGGAGTLGAISGSGLTRTATFTPTANLADGYASWSVGSGTYTDSAGNPGGFGTLTDSGGKSISIYIDTLAPTLAITSYVIEENLTAVADLAGADANNITYSISGSGADNALFSVTSAGALALKLAKDFENPGSAAGSNTYAVTVNMVDLVGNVTNQAVTVNVTDVRDLGDPVIDLGSYGKLIRPVQVDGGNWYYYWDRSGDGSSADTGTLNGGVDYTTRADLNPIFNENLSGQSVGATTTDTHRYAKLNNVWLALPTSGVTPLATGDKNGTSVGSATAANGSLADNPAYDDLLAIWDAYNGTGTGTQTNGTPTGWANASYWSSNTLTSSNYNVANVLTNGSFEDRVLDANGAWSPKGWTSSSGFEIWDRDNLPEVGAAAPSDGRYYLEMDVENGVDIYESTLKTETGAIYTLSFDLAQRINTTAETNKIEFLINNVSKGVFLAPQAGGIWATFSVEFTGSGNDVIKFQESSDNNNSLGGLIDNLRITAGYEKFIDVSLTQGSVKPWLLAADNPIYVALQVLDVGPGGDLLAFPPLTLS